MGLLKLFKKKEIPDELPEIITEGTEEKLEDREIIKNHLNSKKFEQIDAVKEKEEEEPNETKEEKTKAPEDPIIKESFFNGLQDNLFKEVDNLNKLEKWYNNKFLPGDVVTEMRGYWENKKTGSILNILGKKFQEKISGRMATLQRLEKEWQDIYFDLIEKEEEIREHERELKKLLAEFVELCKRKDKESSLDKLKD